MPATLHYPRAFLTWQARAVRARSAHLYRVFHDGRGNWTVTRPGSAERLYFPADDCGTPPQPFGPNRVEPAGPGPVPKVCPVQTMTPAEKHAAEVRSSYVNLSA